jgi:hypothetical protein
MPVTPAEIMLAKVWSMGLVVLLAAMVALVFIVQGALHVPVQGSVALFPLVARICAPAHRLRAWVCVASSPTVLRWPQSVPLGGCLQVSPVPSEQ